MNKIAKNRLYILGFLLLLIILLFSVFQFFTKKSLDVIAPADANIYVKYDPADIFELAGQGKVDLDTGGNDYAYIKVEQNDKTTVTGVRLDKTNNTVTIDLSDVTQGEKLIDIGLANIRIENDTIFGLNPSSQRLLSYDLTPPFEQANFYIGLPDIEKVLWEDAERYIYVAPLAGITSVDGNSRNVLEGAIDIGYLNGVYYILALDGMYTSAWPGADNAITKVADRNYSSGARLHVSDEMILVSNPIEGASNQVFQSQDFIGSIVEIFDEDGQSISETGIDVLGVVSSAAASNGRLFIASDDTLTVYEEGGDLLPEYSFVITAQDIKTHNGVPILLSDDEGVVMFEDDQYKYIEQSLFGERYTSGSLISDSGDIIYSTRLPESSLSSSNDTRPGVYRIDL